MFQKYIGDNVATWFDWSKTTGLPVESMEDLVFVYGCTLVPSWAAAAFDDRTGNAQLSLASRTLDNGGVGFTWSNIRGTVEYHDSQLNPVCSLPVALTCSTLTSLPLFSQKEYSIPSSKSMRFHQVPPSKTRLVLGYSIILPGLHSPASQLPTQFPLRLQSPTLRLQSPTRRLQSPTLCLQCRTLRIQSHTLRLQCPTLCPRSPALQSPASPAA
jgi:hypothetical protein